MQTAAFVGLRAAGVRGAAAAYVGFGLPAVLLMLAASAAYVRVGPVAGVQAGFALLRAMIVALVANAAFTFTRIHVRSVADAVVALGCASAFFLGVSPVAVIAAAAQLEIAARGNLGGTSEPGPHERRSRDRLVASVAVFLPSFVLVVGLAPWFGRLRARGWFAPALHGALLSFVGLLLSTVVQLGRAVDWGIASAALATAAFVALRAGVDVLWVVVAAGLVGAVLSFFVA